MSHLFIRWSPTPSSAGTRYRRRSLYPWKGAPPTILTIAIRLVGRQSCRSYQWMWRGPRITNRAKKLSARRLSHRWRLSPPSKCSLKMRTISSRQGRVALKATMKHDRSTNCSILHSLQHCRTRVSKLMAGSRVWRSRRLQVLSAVSQMKFIRSKTTPSWKSPRIRALLTHHSRNSIIVRRLWSIRLCKESSASERPRKVQLRRTFQSCH